MAVVAVAVSQGTPRRLLPSLALRMRLWSSSMSASCGWCGHFLTRPARPEGGGGASVRGSREGVGVSGRNEWMHSERIRGRGDRIS